VQEAGLRCKCFYWEEKSHGGLPVPDDSTGNPARQPPPPVMEGERCLDLLRFKGCVGGYLVAVEKFWLTQNCHLYCSLSLGGTWIDGCNGEMIRYLQEAIAKALYVAIMTLMRQMGKRQD